MLMVYVHSERQAVNLAKKLLREKGFEGELKSLYDEGLSHLYHKGLTRIIAGDIGVINMPRFGDRELWVLMGHNGNDGIWQVYSMTARWQELTMTRSQAQQYLEEHGFSRVDKYRWVSPTGGYAFWQFKTCEVEPDDHTGIRITIQE